MGKTVGMRGGGGGAVAKTVAVGRMEGGGGGGSVGKTVVLVLGGRGHSG